MSVVAMVHMATVLWDIHSSERRSLSVCLIMLCDVIFVYL